MKQSKYLWHIKSHIVTLNHFKERVVVIYLTLGNLIICSPKQGHSQRIHVHLKGGKNSTSITSMHQHSGMICVLKIKVEE